jgi:hypothetical protein
MSVELRPFECRHYAEARALWEATEGVGLSEADTRPEIEKFLVRNPGLSLIAGRAFWAAIGAEHRGALAVYSLATSGRA